MDNWFSTQVDRDYITGLYGDGIRLYENNRKYYLIKGESYDEKKNILVVKNNKGHSITLSSEPNIEYFKNTLFKDWGLWDSVYGKFYDDDRCDYKPWAHKDLKSLAAELGLYSKGMGMGMGMGMDMGMDMYIK
tara:strand:- start:326 stop:724 length:399 start_codon:yes stop_codon:yes gene_type:complete